MGGFIDSAAVVLAQSVRQSEVAGQNIANLATPAYKRRVYFQALLEGGQVGGELATVFDNGKLIETGSKLDLALGGGGFFVVRDGEQLLFTRQARLSVDADGRLVTAAGHVLQSAQGGDVVVGSSDFAVSGSGLITAAGEAGDRIAVVDFGDRSQLRAVDGEAYEAIAVERSIVEQPIVRQGYMEAANVSTGQEMIALMAAVRRAEAGQRLINVYDDLMGRALSTFGQI